MAEAFHTHGRIRESTCSSGRIRIRWLKSAQPMKLGLTLLFATVTIATNTFGQGTVGFYTVMPQFTLDPILYLSGDRLVGQLATADAWRISIRFPATSTEPLTDLKVLGPIVSAHLPQYKFPGGVTISYRADFTLSESQRSLLLAGDATLILTESIISPGHEPEVFQGVLLPIPEPLPMALLAAGIAALACFNARNRAPLLPPPSSRRPG